MTLVAPRADDQEPLGPGFPARLPAPPGPVTDQLLDQLRRPVHEIGPLPTSDGDPLADDDLALALYLCCELHHLGLPAVEEGLVDQEPFLGGEGVFRARCLAAVDARFAHHLLGAWMDGRSSLRPPEPAAAR